jgi:hypothetical protein
MEDREAHTYSTPPQEGSSPAETQAAQERLTKGLPALMASVFVAFVVVAAIVLAARYLF